MQTKLVSTFPKGFSHFVATAHTNHVQNALEVPTQRSLRVGLNREAVKGRKDEAGQDWRGEHSYLRGQEYKGSHGHIRTDREYEVHD